VEARSRGPKGETLEGVNATRGSAAGHRVTATRRVRIFRMLESLELQLGGLGRRGKQHEGQRRREALWLPGGENLWKRNPRGVTGMKQGREDAGGTRRQDVEKA
jgi:hypothetical protein